MTPAVQPVDRLAECEAVIQHSFEDAGRALMEIRDDRLYREQYATFEDYCRQRWGWSRTHVNEQIAAARAVGFLADMSAKPTNARQAAELRPLLGRPDAAEVIPAVWQEVQSSEKPVTAQKVRDAVRRHFADGPPAVPAFVRHEGEAADAYGAAFLAMRQAMFYDACVVAAELNDFEREVARRNLPGMVAWLQKLQGELA